MDNHEKKVTVIIVTYNAANTLQDCLDSIFSQSYKHIDIVMIDGQSTDGTVNILNKNTNKIKYWKSEPDNGIYDAMNKAIMQIHTPWVYFLGADDTLLKEFSKFAEELKEKSKIYYANVLYKGKKCSGYISSYRQAKSGIFHQSIIYPSSIFKKYKYNTRYAIAADYALNMQLHKDPDYKFEYKDYVIVNYNHTGASTVKDKIFERDKNKMVFRNFGFKIWLRYAFRQFKAFIFSKIN